MEELARLQARLAGINQLLDVVGTLRSIAAVRLQQARHCLPGVREYSEVVADALASALRLEPRRATTGAAGTRKRTVVVFCAEHAFTGGFNERLLERTRDEVGEGTTLGIVGTRGAVMAKERGWEVAWWAPAATHTMSVPDAARRVALELYAGILQGDAQHVDVIFTAWQAAGPPEVDKRRLLPLEEETLQRRLRGPKPLHNLPRDRLLGQLAAEYVHAHLVRAAMESLASENDARLRTMEGARRNADERREELISLERRLRQEQITTELLDITTGAEAIGGRHRH
jgi:F-type H+-transporting ATPase subunit gamma